MKKKAKTKENVTVDDIQVKLKEVRRAQSQMCMQEITRAIEPILAKYKCELDISIILRAGQIIPRLGVISKNI